MPSRLSQGDVAELEWLFCHADAEVSGLHAAPTESAAGKPKEYFDPTDVTRLQLPHARLAAARRMARLTRIRDRLFAAHAAEHWDVLRALFGPHAALEAPSLVLHTRAARTHAVARAQHAERVRVLTLLRHTLAGRVRTGRLSPMAAATKLVAFDEQFAPSTVDLALAMDRFPPRAPALRAAVRQEERELRLAAEDAFVRARRKVDSDAKQDKTREAERWLART